MKFSLILSAMAAAVSATDHLETYTTRFFESVDKKLQTGKAVTPAELGMYFTENSVKVWETEMPFGGTHKGLENISLYYTRLGLTIDGLSCDTNMVSSDEASGVVLAVSECQGTFSRTGNQAFLKLLHYLEWDQNKMKIMKHVIVDRDSEVTLSAYRTEAEQKYWDLIWAFMKSTYEEIIDESSSGWSLVDDRFTLKTRFDPSNLVSKQEYVGKRDAIEGIKEWTKVKMAMPGLKEKMKKALTADADDMLKVLSADETNVFVSYHGGKAIAHYMFERGPYGKLVAEELIMNGPLMPWEVYPFPMPAVKDHVTEQWSQSPIQHGGNGKFN